MKTQDKGVNRRRDLHIL